MTQEEHIQAIIDKATEIEKICDEHSKRLKRNTRIAIIAALSGIILVEIIGICLYM